jgi:hypothetical protein
MARPLPSLTCLSTPASSQQLAVRPVDIRKDSLLNWLWLVVQEANPHGFRERQSKKSTFQNAFLSANFLPMKILSLVPFSLLTWPRRN